MMLKIKENFKASAAFLFSSGVCPLDCKYCFIPKTSSMRKIHRRIIKKLKNRYFIYELKKIYGSNLKHLGLWGAEPTLTLDLVGDSIPELFKNFPLLETVTFSTSLMTDPNLILTFIEKLNESGRKINFICQISLDGPAFIVDVNRIKGAARKVPENLLYILENLNKKKFKHLKVAFIFKSTLTIENIKILNQNRAKVREFFAYFEKIFQQCEIKNKNENVNVVYSACPTLAVPERYSSADGKAVAIFFRTLRILSIENKNKHYWKYIRGPLISYTHRLAKLFIFQDDVSVRPNLFTCNAGDEGFGLGINNDLRLCHRMFFLSDKGYLKSVREQSEEKNWDVRPFKSGNIELANDNYTIKIGNEADFWKKMYIIRNYQDFLKLRISYTKKLLKELAIIGQCREEYSKNEDLSTLFSVYVNTALACCTENILNTGVIYFTPLSIVRIFANGAFKEILKDLKEWGGK